VPGIFEQDQSFLPIDPMTSECATTLKDPSATRDHEFTISVGLDPYGCSLGQGTHELVVLGLST
jgi:hypothetical protein